MVIVVPETDCTGQRIIIQPHLLTTSMSDWFLYASRRVSVIL